MVAKKTSKSKSTSKKSTKKQSSKKTKKASSAKKGKKAKIVYEQPKAKKDYFFPIILIVVALIIIGFVSNGTFFLDSLKSDTPTQVEGDQTVLVTVNGDPIYQGELDEYWERLPPQLKLEISKDQLLNEFVQERLLLQEAEKQGITVSEGEVDEYITAQLTASGLTYDQFVQIVEQQGTDVERMKEIYTRQLTLAKLFEAQNDDELVATPEEIDAYYKDNKQTFYEQEQVTLRHLLVSVNENVDDTTAQERVADLEAQLDEANNENFCDLVSEFSGDPGSVSNCGEYTFAKGVMVEEFETAGFDMSVDERRTVKTAFGYHIMLKDATIPARYLDLDDEVNGATVSEIINRVLVEEKARGIYETYIAELTQDAEIFYTTPQEVEEEEAASNDEENAEEVEEETEPAGDVIVEIN